MSEHSPVPRIIHGGELTDAEIAALVTVLSTRGTNAQPERSLREPLSAWVASGLARGTRTKA